MCQSSIGERERERERESLSRRSRRWRRCGRRGPRRRPLSPQRAPAPADSFGIPLVFESGWDGLGRGRSRVCWKATHCASRLNSPKSESDLKRPRYEERNATRSSPSRRQVGATRFRGSRASGEQTASSAFGSGGGFSASFGDANASWQRAHVAGYLARARQRLNHGIDREFYVWCLRVGETGVWARVRSRVF